MPVDTLTEVACLAARELNRRRIRYFITGMFAGRHWLGEHMHRNTYDVDFSVLIVADRLSPVVDTLLSSGWVTKLSTPLQIALTLPGTPFAVEFLPNLFDQESNGLEEVALTRYFRSAFERSVKVVLRGVRMRIARPDDVIVTKVFLDRQKDRDDILRLLRLEDVDRRYLLAQLRRLGFKEKFLEISRLPPPPEVEALPSILRKMKGRRRARALP